MNNAIVLHFSTDATEEQLKAIAREIAETVSDDYGTESWGGYDGPELTEVHASINGIIA